MHKKQLIRRIVDKIKANYKPQKIILFGSHAWGNPGRDSDLDLLIIKETDEKPRQRFLGVRRLLREENGLIGIDILVYTPREFSGRIEMGDSFLSMVLRRGEVLYG